MTSRAILSLSMCLSVQDVSLPQRIIAAIAHILTVLEAELFSSLVPMRSMKERERRKDNAGDKAPGWKCAQDSVMKCYIWHGGCSQFLYLHTFANKNILS